MVDEFRMRGAIEAFRNYKTTLQSGRGLQAAGLSVPNTRMIEFISMIDSCSRQAVSALELSDPEDMESLGELLLNMSRTIKQKQGV